MSAPGPVRAFIVDDSVVVRRLLVRLFEQDPEIEVVGSAANGRLALAKLPQARPHVVVLDLEMPEMNGLETLDRLREAHPEVAVLIFSSRAQRGAVETLEALARGAADYVLKPSGRLDDAVEELRTTLCAKVKGVLKARPTPRGPVARPPEITRHRPSIELLAIGGSTGAPAVITRILGELPQPFPVPVLIVQHMPPPFPRLFAERLTETSSFRVEVATAGAELEAGRGWIAPADWHMRVRRLGARLVLDIDQEAPLNSCRPSVDALFTSVAEVCKDRALAVMLTGMGRDGLEGCRALAEVSARIIAQDEASSVVWGMPGFVAREGLAEQILSDVELPGAIHRIAQVGRASRSVGEARRPER